MRTPLLASAAAALLVLIPVAAPAESPEEPAEDTTVPRDLHGSYDPRTGQVHLAWSPPGEGASQYRVYLESKLSAQTAETQHTAQPPVDSMWVYLVTAQGADGVWSPPTATAVPLPSCEIVSITTTWSPPYAYVHVHEECIDGSSHHRDVTWKEA